MNIWHDVKGQATRAAVILFFAGAAVGSTVTYVGGSTTASASRSESTYQMIQLALTNAQRNAVANWLTTNLKPQLQEPFNTQTVNWCKLNTKVIFDLDSDTDGSCRGRMSAGIHYPGAWVAGSAE